MREKNNRNQSKKEIKMSKEIKPCPFCGSTTAVGIIKSKDYYEEALQYCCNSGDFDAPEPGYFINCDATKKGCGAVSGWKETKEEVINLWNTRV